MAYNYARSRLTALRLIGPTGFGREGRLERAGQQRKIMCVLIDYSTHERQNNNLIQFADQHCLVAAEGLEVPPDMEQDVVVVGNGPPGRTFTAPFERWRIMAPPGKLDPAGIVVYWDLHVRKG